MAETEILTTTGLHFHSVALPSIMTLPSQLPEHNRLCYNSAPVSSVLVSISASQSST